MTLREAIERFDLLYPNPLPLEAKRGMLSAFDGRLYAEVLSHYEGAPESFAGYDESTPPETPLLAEFPFDDVYLKLLCAENDAVCGDIARYNNAAALFNAAYERYVSHVGRTRRRRDGAAVRLNA